MIRFICFFLMCAASACAIEVPEIKYELIEEMKVEDKAPINLYKFSFPATGKKIKALLTVKKMNNDTTTEKIWITENGSILWEDFKVFKFALTGGYGESFEFFAIEADDNWKAKAIGFPLGKCVVTPFTLSATDKTGHKIEITPMEPTGNLFTVKISGFAPKEKFTMRSVSYREIIRMPEQADDDGCAVVLLSPAVNGQKEGPVDITIGNENMSPLNLRHYWGTIAFSNPLAHKLLRNKYP